MTDVDRITHAHLPSILDETADELLESARWRRPAVDAVAVARRIGLTVARDRKLVGRARYVRLAVGRGRSAGAIFVGEAERPERLQWAVAHELGEFSVHRVFEKAGIAPDRETHPTREQFANELARRILLPRRAFEKTGGACLWDLTELKRVFPSASHELIARRMVDFPAPVVMTVFDHGRVHWRRGNQAGFPVDLCAPERAIMRTAHESQAYQEHSSEDMFIRAWPIHEPGWKREILRTEPAFG